jgi:outer membrane protein assembly factor BamA
MLIPATVSAQAVDRATTADDTDEPGAIQRYRDRYESLKEKGVTFTLGSILPGASLSAGVGYSQPKFLNNYLGMSFDAAWSIRGYQLYDVRLGRLRGRDHRTELAPADADLTSMFNDDSLLAFGTSMFVHWRHRIYPRVDFFGPGQGATKDGRSDFGVRGSSLDVVLQWQSNAHLGLSGRIGTLGLTLEPGTNHGVMDTPALYSDEQAPGLSYQPRYLTAGGAVTLDFRDRPHLTTAGTFVSVGVWHAAPREVDAPDDGWSRFVTEVRNFQPLHGEDHVLALHGLFSTRLGDITTPTPFFLQQTLGGSKTLRGFGSYRLRGDALWSATAEYRWRAHRRVEVAPFIDVGAVASSFADLRDVGPAATPGIGLRVMSSSRVIGRADLAHGRDGIRTVLTLSTPF